VSSLYISRAHLGETKRGLRRLVATFRGSLAAIRFCFPGSGPADARPGQLVIDTTTSDPTTTRRVAAALAAVGVRFLDAPVSGAPQVARAGKLTMMLVGEASDMTRQRLY
jgi:3-hydroxyisobutyrate dehydrogenase-like beta-hydroxyacid dehydrogenase